ncbi:unnamed protein product [Allacma fusca]|uniref:Uncharacterized protein n=1 Tax=Allacma fusca TaxID=39272 RepID=A0A8J2PBS9_9HEXA|nr:unnamed protein product [Allacma fusca]
MEGSRAINIYKVMPPELYFKLLNMYNEQQQQSTVVKEHKKQETIAEVQTAVKTCKNHSEQPTNKSASNGEGSTTSTSTKGKDTPTKAVIEKQKIQSAKKNPGSSKIE